jgi:hypothetical protein
MKKLMLIAVIICGIAVGGVLRFDHLAARPMDLAEFTWLNKVEIYTGYVAMMVAGYPLYPEISEEMWHMLFSSSEGKELVFEDGFFLGSTIVRGTIENYAGPIRLIWHPSHYNLGQS